jgi:MinD superfamily P-loop ATPase
MRQLVIASGKGGAGKTVVAAALTALAARQGPIVLADADVDASNLELLLAPTEREQHIFVAGEIAEIDADRCTGCGDCWDICRFDAVESAGGIDGPGTYRIDTIACEGCAACFHACPVEAVRMKPTQVGLWFRSDTRFGPLVHARLFAGRENSGKLVSLVKREAVRLAQQRSASLVLVDGPPGIGCPLISAIAEADLALLIAEPTASGEHDLERVLAVTEHFGAATAVVINKADLNVVRANAIESLCGERRIPVLGRIPYDVTVDDSIIRGTPLTDNGGTTLAAAFERIWGRLQNALARSERPSSTH